MGCYIWYSEEGTGRGRSPPRLLIAVPNVAAHPSTASVPITVLLYSGRLLCGFNVPVKGLMNSNNVRQWHTEVCHRRTFLTAVNCHYTFVPYNMGILALAAPAVICWYTARKILDECWSTQASPCCSKCTGVNAISHRSPPGAVT